MKKYFVTLFVWGCFLNQLIAQINTTLTVQSQPPANLSEWSIRNMILNYVVDYGRPDPQQVVFKTEIKLLDGTIVASTDLQKVSTILLNRGVSIFYSKDVMPFEYMVFSGQFKNSIEKTGKLPSGQYQICVSILQSGTFQVLAAERCRIFNLYGVQLPFLMMPVNQSIIPKLSAQNAITFRWTPVIPQSAIAPATYRLQVFEILSNQQPVQALRANQPILDISLRGVTQYIWQPRLSFLSTDSTVRYIWTIQTLDASGLPILTSDGNGESRSEPFVFTVRTSAINNVKQ
ncbi:hypothetical protein [Sediminibacterium sp.]|uniref:hypothetical protein n=1 Tax=Sediminibacterium sp. TaxID=1917865 RepID=UPI0025ECF87B|nr:hypothetical protein [Sediminibacterium sp.]